LKLLSCIGSVARPARRCVEQIEFGCTLVAVGERRQQSEACGEFAWVDVEMQARTNRKRLGKCGERVIEPGLLRLEAQGAPERTAKKQKVGTEAVDKK
jgi:hypothetical protein